VGIVHAGAGQRCKNGVDHRAARDCDCEWPYVDLVEERTMSTFELNCVHDQINRLHPSGAMNGRGRGEEEGAERQT